MALCTQVDPIESLRLEWKCDNCEENVRDWQGYIFITKEDVEKRLTEPRSRFLPIWQVLHVECDFDASVSLCWFLVDTVRTVGQLVKREEQLAKTYDWFLDSDWWELTEHVRDRVKKASK